jgi:hypothetical protein
VPLAAVALQRPVRSCFLDPESRNFNRLHLISFHLARTRAYAASKAFEGKPFSHKGKDYTIPPEAPYRGYTLKEITLVPAPERLPVECWQPIQSGSERAFDFMAKYVVDNHRPGRSAVTSRPR